MLGGVNARLVKKLEQLHSLNMLWEARELPELVSLLSKRNLLAIPNGIAWLTGRRAVKGTFAPWIADLNGRVTFRRSDLKKHMVYARKGFISWLANNQLGYSFGLMPTIGDIRAIAESLKKGLKERKNRTTATIIGHEERLYNLPLWPDAAIINRAIGLEKFAISRVDGVRATLLKKLKLTSDTFDQFVTATLGINGATVLWNCVPFSWVADILWSLDDCLDNLWASSQTDYALEYWSSTTTKYERAIEAFTYGDVVGVPPKAATYLESYVGPLKCEFQEYKRDPRPSPAVLSGVRQRVTPSNVYLTSLVALGLIGRFNVSSARTASR
jgi:hypothetical protein